MFWSVLLSFRCGVSVSTLHLFPIENKTSLYPWKSHTHGSSIYFTLPRAHPSYTWIICSLALWPRTLTYFRPIAGRSGSSSLALSTSWPLISFVWQVEYSVRLGFILSLLPSRDGSTPVELVVGYAHRKANFFEMNIESETKCTNLRVNELKKNHHICRLRYKLPH